MIIRRQIRQ